MRFVVWAPPNQKSWLRLCILVTGDITNSQYCMACMYRILHAMSRYHSVRESQIYYNIDSFYALQRKVTYNFIEAVNYLYEPLA